MRNSSDLRDFVIEAHGGHKRWKRFRTIEAEMSITGMLWVRKGWPDALKNVRVTADTQMQQLSYRPFTGESLRSLYRPDEVAIENSDGVKVKSRKSPRAAFEGHKAETGWDDLHLAYFSGYAMWNYLNTPFLFLLPDITTEELAPIEENGERRRRLKVTFSPAVATHGPEQVFYIDDNGFIARLDYSAEITGSGPAAHYTSGYREFDGIKFPTRRRAFLRSADGSAITSAAAVAIDISNVRLS
jgi:hypothetical protein